MKLFKHKILISLELIHIFLILIVFFGLVFHEKLNIDPITLIKIGTFCAMSLYILGAWFSTKNFMIIKKNEIEIKEKNTLNLIFFIYVGLIIGSFIYILFN
jgi:hypothetical protein